MDVSQLSKEQAKHAAVAYLAKNAELRPEQLVHYFTKLEKYDSSAVQTHKKIVELKGELEKLDKFIANTIGSIQAVVDLIADEMSDEDVLSFATKYCQDASAKENETAKTPGTEVVGRSHKASDVDVAGSTAHINDN